MGNLTLGYINIAMHTISIMHSRNLKRGRLPGATYSNVQGLYSHPILGGATCFDGPRCVGAGPNGVRKDLGLSVAGGSSAVDCSRGSGSQDGAEQGRGADQWTSFVPFPSNFHI